MQLIHVEQEVMLKALNISTASSTFIASTGIKVAKHRLKAVSSKYGSPDVLEKLNINIDLDAKSNENSINNLNFGFMLLKLSFQQ